MSLSPLELLAVVLVPVLLGVALLRLQGVVPRTDPLGYGGWAWLQGALGFAVVLSLWLWLGLPLRAGALALAVLVLSAALFALGAKRVTPLAPSAPERAFPRWERALFAVVLALVALGLADRILIAGSTVIVNSDEGLIWAAKAKALFAAGSFGPEFVALMARPGVVGHMDYPPLNSLLQLWTFVLGGEILHVENRLPVQAFGIALLLLVASAARRRARPAVAAAFVACLGAVSFTSYSMLHAFSDLLVACALFACCDLWQRFEEDGQRVWLRLFATTVPLLPWSKNEGRMLVLAGGLALVAALALRRARLSPRRELAREWPLCLPLAASLAYLLWFNRHFGFVNDLLSSQMLSRGLRVGLTRLPVIARYLWELVSDSAATNLLLLLFFALSLVAPLRALARGRMAFTLTLLFALAGYVVVYMGTSWDVEHHLDHSAKRVFYQVVPAAGLWVLLAIVELLPEIAARGARARASVALDLEPAPS